MSNLQNKVSSDTQNVGFFSACVLVIIQYIVHVRRSMLVVLVMIESSILFSFLFLVCVFFVCLSVFSFLRFGCLFVYTP